MLLCLALPTFSASASAYSILWVSTSDHTDLVKDEEYEAASAMLFMAPSMDDDASGSVECVDGLEILYEGRARQSWMVWRKSQFNQN